MITRILIALALVALAGCAERAQTASGIRSDSAAWQGPGQPYAAPGWKAGDKAGWEQQLRVRTQRQNEYVRIG